MLAGGKKNKEPSLSILNAEWSKDWKKSTGIELHVGEEVRKGSP